MDMGRVGGVGGVGEHDQGCFWRAERELRDIILLVL